MKSHSITVRIDADKYSRLTELAGSMERSKSYLVEDALTHYLSVNEWQVSEIKKALVQADDVNTKWISHEAIKNEFSQI